MTKNNKSKIKNSTILLVGVLFIAAGVVTGFFEYFEQKKEKTFSEMNILLYENSPKNFDSNEEANKEINSEEENSPNSEENSNPNGEENNNPTQPETPKPSTAPNYDYIGVLEIPKINLKRGFVDLNSKYNSVKYNVTVINGSTFPDQKSNNLILAAHSGNCYICYFDKLYKLGKNDTAYVYYRNIKYTYKIVDIYEVEKTGTVAIYRDYSKNCLTLITCTRNSNTKQTVYILELTGKENT